MSLQWLQMRIEEEQERRRKEQEVLERLPAAFDEVHRLLSECIAAYNTAFGAGAAAIQLEDSLLRISISEQPSAEGRPRSAEVTTVPSLPGFRVERAGHEPLAIEIGVLGGEKLYYRLEDRYLSLEEVSRQILDRALFPKLPE